MAGVLLMLAEVALMRRKMTDLDDRASAIVAVPQTLTLPASSTTALEKSLFASISFLSMPSSKTGGRRDSLALVLAGIALMVAVCVAR